MKHFLLVLAFILLAISAGAQTYELSCPAGSTPLFPVGVTFDNATGKYRQWLCVDTNGNVTASGIGGGGTPSGPVNGIQFNNGGSFGASGNAQENTSGQVFFGSDGVSSIGSMVYLLGSENFSITNSLAAVATFTGSGSGFVGQSASAFQSVVNPASNDHLTFYTAINAVTQTPTALTSTIGIMEGIFGESRYNGTGTIGGNSGDFGLAGGDFEAFVESSAIVGSIGGVRGVYGNAGYLGSGSSPNGNVFGGEFQFEIGNGSSGTLGNAFGVSIDTPLNSGGTGTTTVTNYTALAVNCAAASFITNYNCIVVNDSGSPAANNLGTGTTQGRYFFANAGSGNSSANAPAFILQNTASHHSGFYAGAVNDNIAIAVKDTLGVEIDFSWGMYLHDGDCLAFSGNTTIGNKDTSLCRAIGTAGWIGVGQAVNGNDVSGGVVSAKYATSNVTSTALTAGQTVKADPANSGQVRIATTADTGAGIVVGFCGNSPSGGGNCFVMTSGIINTPIMGTGTCAIGNWIIEDTTTNGEIKCATVYPTPGTILGTALTAQAVVGNTVTVAIGLK